jgi:tetratricopeptide (TPR) repeat protein
VHLLVVGMVLFGQGEFAGSFLARYQQVASETPDCDPVFLAWLKASWCQLLATSPREGLWQPERAYQLALESADEMAAAGFATGEVSTFLYLGAASLQVGRYEEADAACRRCISLADRTGMMFLAQWARLVLAMSLTRRHRHEEALSVTLPLQSCADENVVQHSHVACAEAYARMSRFDLALGHAQAAVEGTSQPGRYFGGAVLARTYLSLGRAEEALATIERTLRESVPGSSEHEVDALTTRAQALYAVGKVDEARSAIEHARSKVLQIAGGIANADLRRSFLVAVEPNARALELAAAWSGAEAT